MNIVTGYRLRYPKSLIILLISALSAAVFIAQNARPMAAAPQTPLNYSPSACGDNANDIGGTVWRDYNANGVQDALEPGYGASGMVVNAYADNNASPVATATIANDGTYTLVGLSDGSTRYRLEFSGFPSYLQPGGAGSQNGTSVQFVTNATCGADLGLNNPTDYCEANPTLAIACYENGTGTGNTNPGLVSFTYDASGIPATYGGTAQNPSPGATVDDIGSVWGAGYQRTDSRLFLASFLKRHVGFADNPSTVYVVDYAGAPSVVDQFDLQGVSGIDLGSVCRRSATDGDANASCDPFATGDADDYLLPAISTTPNVDLDGYTQVGRVSFGDIDVSEDNNTLWLINLYQKGLISVDISGYSADGSNALPGTVVQYDLASLTGAPTCAGAGNWRPFALEFNDGLGYLGSVCDANGESSAELRAYVHSFDPSNVAGGLNVIIDFALDYTREVIDYNQTDAGEWNPWVDTWTINSASYPQPILSDLVFTEDGDIVLGFMDRFSHQVGNENFTAVSGSNTLINARAGGDLLHVCNYNGEYVLEGTDAVKCPVSDPAPADGLTATDGPGGTGEFYYGDYFKRSNRTFAHHPEVATGALALRLGSGEVVNTVWDPISDPLFTVAGDEWRTNGVRWFSTSTGNSLDGYRVVDQSNDPSTFGKASGLGDLELMCALAPLTIGNYVWRDADGDGVQDPSEAALANVQVQLWLNPDGVIGNGDDLLVTTVSTNGDGEYYFSAEPNSTYYIAIDPTQAVLTGLNITPANYSSDSGMTDVHDSDGVANGATGLIVATVNTGAAGHNDYSYDFGFTTPQAPQLLGSIGNYVWLDENGDGVQDAGERGIPNVIVNLTDSSGTVYTITTDTNGGYLFSGLLAGTYTVTVPTAGNTALNGLNYTTPNANGGADFGNQDPTGYAVTIGGGAPLENLSADFGYNVNTPNETDNNTGNAALGDRIWIDVDGDGAQDPNEVGVSGVVVTLYHDPDGDGVYDTVYGTTTTDATGLYIFDNLPAGGYVVTVTDSSSASHDILGADFNQTGDPDHFGTTGSVNDNTTTSPVVLAPGDVFLNADFGYQPTVTLGSLGDTVWFDANASGTATVDAGEYGLAGVTVALIADTNGNGAWDMGEPIIASDTTDANGMYLFSGLSLDDGGGDAAYLVWVNDVDTVLTGLDQTYDEDAPLDHMSTAVLSSGNPSNLNQDFSYTPQGHSSGSGLIGDTIWFDADGSGGSSADAGEHGIEGVVVTLTDSSGTVITTTTNESGNYYFGGLDPNGTYTVTVSPVNFTAGSVLAGMSNTYDPFGGNDGVSVVDLSATGPINLDQDFSYVATTPHNLGNLVWLDQNADGEWAGETGPDGVAATDDDETIIAGVTVDLYRDLNGNGRVDAADPLLATTTTAGALTSTGGDAGNYLFTGLPDGNYVVDVTDIDNILAGYWHSLGNNNTSNHSQADPYATAIAGADNMTADFGYYVEGAAVGNFVWFDADGDGLQDAGESPITNTLVTLNVVYPNGTAITLTTRTDATGFYDFQNLLLDEDTTGATGSEPTHTISVATPANLVATLIDVNSNGNNLEDSEDPNGTPAQPVQGLTDTSQNPDPTQEQTIAGYDFGFTRPAAIGDYVWYDADADGVQDGKEVGIANVLVGLYDSDGSLIATEYTNANGGYLFDGLAPGTYTVAILDDLGVLTSYSPTSGPQVYTGSPITLAPGDVYVDADFGYVIDPAPTNAVLGDTVWFDADGDGIQDAEEVGIEGVMIVVTDGTNTYTTTTDALGNYLIELPAGAYTVTVDTSTLPSGLTQTYDFDEALDNSTTVILADGDQFLDADFGYTSPALGSIGNQVWEDVSVNGLYDSGTDRPIVGVTVELIRDSNGNGAWDAGEPLIGSQTTNTNGQYLFTGLSADDYLVFVSDNARVLLGYTNTTLGATPGADNNNQVQPYAIALGAGEDNLTADFGYVALVPFGDPVGAIGNQVWLDHNDNGLYEPASEDGIAGVVIQLTMPSGTIITTTTNSEGRYLFDGLTEVGTYRVQVIDTFGALNGFELATLGPSQGSDGNNQLQPYAITLGAGEVNLTGDFGYKLPLQATAVQLNQQSVSAEWPLALLTLTLAILAYATYQTRKRLFAP